jgi:hypothetical protein
MAVRLKDLVLTLLAGISCWAGCERAEGAEAVKINLSVAYYGQLQSARGKDFVSFLNQHFTKVNQCELISFNPKEAAACDVALLDYDELKIVTNHIQMPPIPFDSSYSRPMMTLGATGAMVCQRLRLKTGYLWNCCSEAAQGELPRHEVFSKPLRVEPQYETWPTPDNYRFFAKGTVLPKTLKVWRVQQTRRPEDRMIAPYGAVARPFDATPEAEPLVLGYNTGKMSGAVAVGRDHNFLQWGFSAPPSKMTPAGRNLFINCVCYIAKFKSGGAKP